MTLTKLFLPLTIQEFPPKHVYAYVGASETDCEVKQIDVKQLQEYETMYEYSGIMIKEKSNIWNDPKSLFELPLLTPKND
jgi:hypothetical protein